MADSKKVTAYFKTVIVHKFFSSPYKRSVDTISGSAALHNLDIFKDERLRERQKGKDGNDYGMFQKRWADFTFCEHGGEPLGTVQKRNIEALSEVLRKHKDESVVIGTHGTALSSILNYYNPNFMCEDFLRIIDFMPYIIRLGFSGTEYLGQEEILIVKKEFAGTNRADKA